MSYIQVLADRIRSEIAPELVPEGDVDALFLLYAVLAKVKGSDVSLEDVHDAWSAWMTLRSERHEAVVPFSQLDQATQEEDRPFQEAILRAVARP